MWQAENKKNISWYHLYKPAGGWHTTTTTPKTHQSPKWHNHQVGWVHQPAGVFPFFSADTATAINRKSEWIERRSSTKTNARQMVCGRFLTSRVQCTHKKQQQQPNTGSLRIILISVWRFVRESGVADVDADRPAGVAGDKGCCSSVSFLCAGRGMPAQLSLCVNLGWCQCLFTLAAVLAGLGLSWGNQISKLK